MFSKNIKQMKRPAQSKMLPPGKSYRPVLGGKRIERAQAMTKIGQLRNEPAQKAMAFRAAAIKKLRG